MRACLVLTAGVLGAFWMLYIGVRLAGDRVGAYTADMATVLVLPLGAAGLFGALAAYGARPLLPKAIEQSLRYRFWRLWLVSFALWLFMWLPFARFATELAAQ